MAARVPVTFLQDVPVTQVTVTPLMTDADSTQHVVPMPMSVRHGPIDADSQADRRGAPGAQPAPPQGLRGAPWLQGVAYEAFLDCNRLPSERECE